jgi:hypothetical protein
LPIYNEFHVLPRLLGCVAALDYPAKRLEVQVLDDSDDETGALAGRLTAALRERGFKVIHLRRTRREGFKAGALQAGLERAEGQFIALFDADFAPQPDFLKRTLPYLLADPGLGLVQARWDHLNPARSLLTRVQALMLDGHFAVEQQARSRTGLLFNFNGTAGVWRRRAILEAGGWQADTLTEDLDLSYRAQLCGWRFAYLPELAVPAELPADINAFKAQQRRWAKGSIQTAAKLLPRVLRAPLSLPVKLEALLHLTQNLAYPMLLMLALLLVPTIGLAGGGPGGLWLALPCLGLGCLAVTAFYAAAVEGTAGSARRLLHLPALMAVGVGLSASNGLAVVEALMGGRGEFQRTPKTGSVAGSRTRYRAPAGLMPLLELAMAGWLSWGTRLAVERGAWASLPVFGLFLAGFGGIGAAALAAPLKRLYQQALAWVAAPGRDAASSA